MQALTTFTSNLEKQDRGIITIIYDLCSEACRQAIATLQMREKSLPRSTPTVKFIAWPSPLATEALEKVRAQLKERNLGREYSMDGKLIAILPSGLVLPDCQCDVMQVIYEMENMVFVQPPRLEMKARILEHFGRLRSQRDQSSPGMWWRFQSAKSCVADALDDLSFCILEDFLLPEVAQKITDGIFASKPQEYVPAEGKCGWTRGGTARAAEAIKSEGGFDVKQERLARALVSHTRGDILKYSDTDADMPGSRELFDAVDDLVMGLKTFPKLAERLKCVDFANSAMFTVYPGGAARYIKHIDNSLLKDGRRLTAILYLNEGWEPSHGGCLRIFEPTMQSTVTKMDVEPLWNRLVIFWSTDEVPHEVLSCFRDRAAVSIWYICSRECMQTEEGFKRLVTKARCIGNQARADRLVAAGETTEQQFELQLLATCDSVSNLETLPEARRLLAAITNDFEGSDWNRAQRQRMDIIFGWSTRAAEMELEIATSQMQQQRFFEALGILPAGIEVNHTPHVQTTASKICSGQLSLPTYFECVDFMEEFSSWMPLHFEMVD